MDIKGIYKKQIAHFEEKINARNLRERALILTTFVIVLFMIWRSFIISYLASSTDQIIANKERLNTQITMMQGQIQNLSEAIKNDSMMSLEVRLKSISLKNISLKEQIEQKLSELTNSDEMIDILKNLLSEDAHLKIEKIESVSEEPILKGQSDTLVYKKGVQLTLEGDYFSTIRFLEKMEQEEIKIIWDTLVYEVIDYPLSKVKITLHTMGPEKGWLHV
ncbi:MAG: hypothetical protein RLZ35_510 [Pseudomonadota bacterium]|jgi:MSHA biogenesis protein MshJ